MELINTGDFKHLNDEHILRDVDGLKESVDSMRPLSADLEARVLQKFKLDWNYHSNAIEGNSLDYGETAAFLMLGITAKGKPFKDYFDIQGHDDAIDYLTYLVKNKEELTEKDIRGIHKLLLNKSYTSPSQTIEGINVQRTIAVGEYKRMPNHVKTITGETHYYATPEDTPILMQDLVDWYKSVLVSGELHPVVLAAIFHHRFTSIHPFDDGNGRMSRLLMNLILMQFHYPPVVINVADKNEYYLYLSQADTGNFTPFLGFISSRLIHSLNLYLKAANGESLEEESDLKKRLHLFKKEVEARRDKIELRRSFEVQEAVFQHSVRPLMNALTITLSEFKDLFLNYDEFVVSYITRESRWNFEHADAALHLDFFLKNSQSTDNTLFLNLRFGDFKLAENSFSIDLVLLFLLDDLRYSIQYSLLNGNILRNLAPGYNTQWLNNTDYFVKYYHQQIGHEEISSFVNKIGNNMFSFMKALFEGAELTPVEINEFVVSDMWKDIIHNDRNLSFSTKELAIQRFHVKITANQIKIIVSSAGDMFSDVERRRLEVKLYRSLFKGQVVERNIFITVDEELPF